MSLTMKPLGSRSAAAAGPRSGSRLIQPAARCSQPRRSPRLRVSAKASPNQFDDLSIALGGAAVVKHILGGSRGGAATRGPEPALAALINKLAAAAPGPAPPPAAPGGVRLSNTPPGRSSAPAPPATTVQAALTDLAAALAAALQEDEAAGPAVRSAPLKPSGSGPRLPAAARIRLALDDWADRVLPESGGPAGSANPALARAVFRQLVANLLPAGAAAASGGAEPPAAAAAAAALGPSLLAAAAAALTAANSAAAAAGRPARPRKVVATAAASGTSATGDDGFDPDVWEAAAAAAAAAIGGPGDEGAASPVAPPLSPAAAAAAVSSDSSTFDPDAWQAAAAAAAAAAATEDDGDDATTPAAASGSASAQDYASSAPVRCWIVQLLQQSLQASAAAAEAAAEAPDTAAAPAAGALTVFQLALLPAADAAAHLQLLDPAERMGLLLLLAGGGAVSRGDSWLLALLARLGGHLGLAEAGVLLAAIHHRFGRSLFLKASRQLLPLAEPSDPALTLTIASASSGSATGPAAALQALLLHWLLLPQLAAAGLPALPERKLPGLLAEVAAACSSRQLQLAARWGNVAPLTHLHNTSGSSSSTHNHAAACWQLEQPSYEASVISGAWCGLCGIAPEQLARVVSSAAAALLSGSADSGSRQQLSRGSAAAANDARAVTRALLLGLAPLQPMLLLVMQQVLLLPAAVAAGGEWQAALLQLLLEASSSSPLAVVSVAELIDQAFWGEYGEHGSSTGSPHQARLVQAAAAVLLALPAHELQRQLEQLVLLQAERRWARQGFCEKIPTAAAGSAAGVVVAGALPAAVVPLHPGLLQLVVSLAEQADPAQAAALLAVLPMPAWAASWAVFVGPASGSFCWSSPELASVLAGLVSARSTTAPPAAAGWRELEAAWAVIASHFAMADVRADIRGRQHRAAEAEQQDWSAEGSSFAFRPGVPFVGDGWDQAAEPPSEAAADTAASGSRSSCFSGSLGDLAAAVLHQVPLPTAALHIAALAAALPPAGFARVANRLLDAARPAQPSPVAKAVLKLSDVLPELPEAPAAIQLLAAAACWLPVDRVPALVAETWGLSAALQRMPWLQGSGWGWGEDAGSSSVQQQVELVLAAAGVGRDSGGLQHLLSALVKGLDAQQAGLALQVLGGGVSDAAVAELQQQLADRVRRADSAASGAAAAAAASARDAGELDSEVVWQMGQSNAAVGASLATAAAAATRPAPLAGGSGDAAARDRQLVASLSDAISNIPAAPPAGSFSMDAMQDPSRIAQLIKRSISLLIDWSPSCPAAAAAAAQQLQLLFSKRAWSAAESAAVLQRLPLPTALQLLLEGRSGSGWWQRRAPAMLASLVEWHGAEETVDAVRALFVQYKQHSIAGFVELLADMQPALAASAAPSSATLWGLPLAAPNVFVASVLHVLSLMRGISPAVPAAAGGSWAVDLARVLCLLELLTPASTATRIAEQTGKSLALAPASAKPAGADGEATLAWQQQVAQLLAALPAAAAATAAKGCELWGSAAAAIAAGAAASAGSAAMLPALAAAVRLSAAGSSGSSSPLAAHLPELLQQLQDTGGLTCGHFPAATAASIDNGGSAACIKLQVVLLLRDLHQQRLLSLQQAVAALLALAPTLHTTLPLALVTVFGHPKARGYGSLLAPNPDAAAAVAALEAAAAAAAPPTAAAVPAASATAAKQLSEVLCYCHELLPDGIMRRLVSALAAVIPWSTDDAIGSGGSAGLCAADDWAEQQGWSGVTQLLLVSTSLLNASCAMWGIDKGTVVGASLISQLVAAGAPPAVLAAETGSSSSSAADAEPASAASGGETGSRVLRRSGRIAGTRRSGGNPGEQAFGAQQALMQAASSGASTAAASRGSTHAAAAEAALRQAAAGGPQSTAGQQQTQAHAEAAQAALAAAAATGAAVSAAGSHAARAAAALAKAAATHTAAPSSSHTQRSQQALLWAATTGGSEGHALLAAGKLLAAATAGSAAAAAAPASMLWAVEQLQAAAERVAAEGGASARAVVASLVAESAAAVASNGARLSLDDALQALVAALPLMVLPEQLVVQVLVQCQGCVPAAAWAEAVQAVALVAAAGPQRQQGMLALLEQLVQEAQLQLRVNVQGPDLYAAILMAAAAATAPADSRAAAGLSDESQLQACLSELLLPLLQLMLRGRGSSSQAGSQGVPLSASGAGQLLIELSRRQQQTEGDEGAASSAFDPAAIQQLLVVGIAAPAALRHFIGSSSGSGSSSSSGGIFVGSVASQIYQAALLPRVYLTLLLQPHMARQQFETAIRQTGITSSATSDALAALQLLCKRLPPGRQLPLAAFAECLAVALDLTTRESFKGVSFPEARTGLQLEQQQRQQLLLAGVVSVLGSFRGLRRMHDSPAAARLLLPLADLAAVLCFAWELLPSATAAALAAAVAAALTRQQLEDLLPMLPNAAAAGFAKGRELWRPVLHCMTVSGGISEPQEADITSKLLAVAAQQEPRLPILIPCSFEGNVSSGSSPGSSKEAAPAAAAVSTAAASTAAAAAAAAADEDSLQVLESLAAVSLAVASSAATGALAAGYGAAGALVGLLWGAASLAAAALVSSSGSIGDPETDGSKANGSGSSTAGGSSGPETPRTPAAKDRRPGSDIGSHPIAAPHHPAVVMGGRTKPAPADTPGTSAGDSGVPAAASYAGAAAAAAAAAACGGSGGLGSLAVDPDEVMKRIRSQSALLPLDEALMQVVPLLLLPPDSSSGLVWPLLALSAVVHSKHPAASATLSGPANRHLLNLALQATLSSPDGPLGSIMAAGRLLGRAASSHTGNASSGLSAHQQQQQLDAALTAAESVDPWAVAMQLGERLVGSLWDALQSAARSSPPSRRPGAEAETVAGLGALASPEAAASAWQAVVTDLLLGCSHKIAARILGGFASRQASWEAELRALAVAAALEQQPGRPGSSGSGSGELFQQLLAEACERQRHPPVSFLVMLLQHRQVPLGPGDTAVVLQAALQQLLGSYSTVVPGPAADRAGAAQASSELDLLGNELGWDGAFDAWGFDSLFRDLDLFGNGSSSSSSPAAAAAGGPRYIYGSGAAAAPAAVVPAAVPVTIIRLVQSLAEAAAGRGHAVQAADFLMHVLLLAQQQGSDCSSVGSGSGGLVLVMSSDQVAQLLATAADCCIAALAAAPGSSSGLAPAAAQESELLAVLIPDLLSVLADGGEVAKCSELAAAVCSAWRRQAVAERGSSHGLRMQAGGSAWLTAQLASRAVAVAAAGVGKSEGGSLSAAKPGAAALLSLLSEAVFGGSTVEECLVLLAALAAHLPTQLGLQLVSASAGKLHSVMPQAVAIVRSTARKE